VVREPYGSAELHLLSGVLLLNEAAAVFDAMLDGWCSQMVGGRSLRMPTVTNRIQVVRQFQRHAGEWPWTWSAAMLDEWMTDLVATHRLAASTMRRYQDTIRQFCDFVCSPHYGWVAECETRFGTHPVQVCHEWNARAHVQGSEANPARRPLTRDELQAVFDRADEEVDRRLDAGRKGAIAAYRDATMLKVAYGWGLRANEAVMLEVHDFYRNPKVPIFDDFGFLRVRFGKASRGSPPKPRAVATVMPWAVDAVRDYLDNVLPMMRGATSTCSLWLSERGERVGKRALGDRFAQYRDELGLDRSLTPHCLRHSYATHLIEDGHDPTFVQRQLGHAYQSTTGIYTHVSAEFANRILQDALDRVPQFDTMKGTP